MKKLFFILAAFLGVGLVVCFGCGFLTSVNAEVPSKSIFTYKILIALGYFLNYLPALICTGYVVSCCVVFGQNSEGSSSRFSSAMSKRYRTIMLTSILIALVFTLFNEIGLLLISRKKNYIINQPKIINQYVQVGNNLLENGFPQRGILYAEAALKLDQDDEKALILRDKCDEEINKMSTSNSHFELYKSSKEQNNISTTEKLKINTNNISKSYDYLLTAQEYFNNKQWFNAHYYAQQGIMLTSSKDPNLLKLKNIATQAWNNISEYRKLEKDANQKIYEKKYEGYLALLENNDLKAYYIFNELSLSSRELNTDPDIIFYLNIAEERIKEKYFFIDETFEIASFENAHDVCFSYKYADGSKDIIYYKGVTAAKNTGNSLQYLRNFNMVSLNADGSLYKQMQVPYAKVLPISVNDLDIKTQESMNLPANTKFVPYIILTSISRNNPNDIVKPSWKYSNNSIETLDYMILPIPFDDFCMLQSNFEELKTNSLISLITFVPIAAKYGYSERISASHLLNRIYFPFFIIIVFVLFGAFGWNNRIPANQYFKLSYIGSFPFFLIIGGIAYNILYFIFRILNFILLAISANFYQGIIAALVIYTLFLLITSIYFLSRKANI